MPALSIIGVGLPADMPTSNCQGDCFVMAGVLWGTFSGAFPLANAIPVPQKTITAKKSCFNNMFVIIVIKKSIDSVFFLKIYYL